MARVLSDGIVANGLKYCFFECILIFTAGKEALIKSASEMKKKTHGAEQARPIHEIGELASTAQHSDSPAQPVNQCFHSDPPERRKSSKLPG